MEEQKHTSKICDYMFEILFELSLVIYQNSINYQIVQLNKKINN